MFSYNKYDWNKMFNLTPEQHKRLTEWLKTKSYLPFGAIGGRFTYSFTDTSLGTIIKVTDNCTKDELDLTEYEEW